MKSNRYRSWRFIGNLVLGAIFGFVMSYLNYHPELFAQFRMEFDWSLIQLILTAVALLSFAGEFYYLAQSRKAARLLTTLSDDEETEQADKVANRAYNLATIFGGVLGTVVFINLALMAMTVGKDVANLAMAVQVLLVAGLGLYSARLIRLGFKEIYGQEMPKNLSVKEMHQFLLGLMDEAEKQIQFEENYSLVLRLTGYIIPSTYFILCGLRVIFGIDIMLTVVVVSALYVYILVSQYRIIKRYYK